MFLVVQSCLETRLETQYSVNTPNHVPYLFSINLSLIFVFLMADCSMILPEHDFVATALASKFNKLPVIGTCQDVMIHFICHDAPSRIVL